MEAAATRAKTDRAKIEELKQLMEARRTSNEETTARDDYEENDAMTMSLLIKMPMSTS